VVEDPRVAAVTLTGSEEAGAQTAAIAGRCLKKTVLELGGSDAFVVLEDADIEAAATTAVRARFQNCGQSCIAAKRFIVVDAVAERFEEAFVAAVRRLRVGDPTDPGTTMGPLARDDLRDDLERQLQGSLDRGARLLTGGRRPDRRGWFYEPTVLTGCTTGMPAFDDGDIRAAGRGDQGLGEDEARRLANHSDFGLGGNVWTRDVERGVRFARSLETGGVFVNGMTTRILAFRSAGSSGAATGASSTPSASASSSTSRRSGSVSRKAIAGRLPASAGVEEAGLHPS